jgi:hypothetical protein
LFGKYVVRRYLSNDYRPATTLNVHYTECRKVCLEVPIFHLLALGRLRVSHHVGALSNKLNDTTGILDLLFGFRTDVTRLDNDGDADATLAQ